jgi:hypothetical protein
MSRQQTTRRQVPTGSPHRQPAVSMKSSQKSWTLLIYMCGDNDLEPFINEDFAEICRMGSQPNIHNQWC